MKTCSKCGRARIREVDVYCPNCGSRELRLPVVTATKKRTAFFGSAANDPQAEIVTTERGVVGEASGELTASLVTHTLAKPFPRAVAILIDDMIFLVITGLSFFPILGNFLATVLAVLYYALRDASGASAGKRIMGLKVLSKSGRPPTKAQCVGRNIIFVLPSLGLIIPVFGFFAANGVETIFVLLEAVLVLTTRYRLGDRMASTMVVQAR